MCQLVAVFESIYATTVFAILMSELVLNVISACLSVPFPEAQTGEIANKQDLLRNLVLWD